MINWVNGHAFWAWIIAALLIVLVSDFVFSTNLSYVAGEILALCLLAKFVWWLVFRRGKKERNVPR